MSVHIRSLLRKKDGSFTPVQAWEGPIGDSEYLEGALELTVNRVPLMTTVMWDYIDELWAYIINALEELVSSESVSAYFPDQPIEFTMKKTSPGRIHVSIGSRSGKFDNSTQVQEQQFARGLIDGGQEFFLKMMELNPGSRDQYEHEVERLDRLRSAYSE